MKIKQLNHSDRSQIITSYSIPDIYNLIWTLLRYALERNSKNIGLKLCVSAGTFEIRDDGDALDLAQMENESILLKNLKNICEYSIRTRTKLGLYSEKLENSGVVTKVEADRVYRNVITVKELFKSQSLRCKVALDGLLRFEKMIKIVFVENCNIDWVYDCEDSRTHCAVKIMKTKLGRCLALFKGKYQIIFETTIKGIETLATCATYKEEPIVLLKGLPYESTQLLSLKNVLYVNYNNIEGQYIPKTHRKIKQDQVRAISKKTELKRGAIEARSDRFKGFRENLDVFKVQTTLNAPGQARAFLKDLLVIGQFDKKAIITKRSVSEFDEIWMFDQHACAERINLETLMRTCPNLNREEMNMKACKSAIKFGDQIDTFEQEEIIKQLEKCQEPFHCAHGRPTCWLLAKIRK